MKNHYDADENFIEELHIKIGKKVKQKREEAGMSQLKLANAIGHKSVSLVAGAEIYYKKQHFSLEHLAKIAFVLEIDMVEFFNQ